MSKTAAHPATPHVIPSGNGQRVSATQKVGNQRTTFIVMALNMSWQLALAVFVPIVGGVELDKGLHSGHTYLFVGLALALIATTFVMWRTVQLANKLPVPKLTAAQKRAIQKQYEEDDKDA